jgi:hypothetical protein
MMFPAIDNPTSCEIHAVNPSQIMHGLQPNYNNEGTVRQWCRMFKDGSTTKFVKDSASQFQNFQVNFHKVHALFSMGLSQVD